MMSREQEEAVKQVLRRLTATEDDNEWTAIDDYISALQELDEDQLMRESEIVYLEQQGKTLKCNIEHKTSTCIAPKFFEAAEAIIQLYKETGNLHPANQYILEYYVTLSYLRVIQVQA